MTIEQSIKSPLEYSLSARAGFEGVQAALASAGELTRIEAIGVLHNLRAVGASAPAALSLLTQRLDAHVAANTDDLGDVELSENFTVQIAQHYIDEARACVEAAAAALDHAMCALSSLLDEHSDDQEH